MTRGFSGLPFPPSVTTRLVSRRAMDMLFEGSSGEKGNWNLQHNSISVLPKAERAKLNLYDSMPRKKLSAKALRKRVGEWLWI